MFVLGKKIQSAFIPVLMQPGYKNKMIKKKRSLSNVVKKVHLAYLTFCVKEY